eukprot:s724_g37.t1
MNLAFSSEYFVLETPESACNSWSLFFFFEVKWNIGGDTELVEIGSQDEHPENQSIEDLFGVNSSDVRSVDYEPSIAQTDFSGFLPWHVFEEEVELTSDYKPETVVQSAWNSLQSDSYKLPWETGFWDQFLNPNVTVWDQMSSGFKRPFPVAHLEIGTAASSTEVDRRVVAKTFPAETGFLKNIRDVPEKTWKEEREAKWEIAIRRWVALLDQWSIEGSLLLKAIHECNTFTEKAQILVDVFFNKAPQTLLKRANSLHRVCAVLQVQGMQFPCSESQFYAFLKSESEQGAKASRLKACFEAVVFARFVLGIEILQQVVSSRRCLGAASHSGLGCPRQADSFTVKQLTVLHSVLRDDEELWNKCMAGMILFCVYARSRWSDAQHAEELVSDYDSDDVLQFLEVKTADATQEAEQSEPSSVLEASVEPSLESWCKVSSATPLETAESSEPGPAVEVQNPGEEGHVTTDSSDSSDDGDMAWGPVVGHYEIELPADKSLWRNQNSKMFHLSHEEHVRVLLCGRRITASFVKHSGAVRFDSAKCRQCFRLKDS